MIRLLIIFCLIPLIVSGGVRAQLDDSSQELHPWDLDPHLQKFLNEYYLYEPVHLVPQMITKLRDTGYLDQEASKQAYVIGFFAALFKQNHELVPLWLERAELSQYQAGAMIRAARFAGMGDTAKIWAYQQGWEYQNEADAFADLDPYYRSQIRTPEDVQRLWGDYVVRQDQSALTLLLNTMRENNVPLDEESMAQGDFSSFQAQALSGLIEGLFVNAAIQYPQVYAFVNDTLESKSGKADEQLQKIIAKIHILKRQQPATGKVEAQ